MKVFLQGDSLGGLISLQLVRKHKDLFDGLLLIAPLIKVSEDSNPSEIVQFIGRGINYLFPTLAIIEGNNGKNNTYKKYQIEFEKDPLNYNGKVLIGTGNYNF